MGLASTKDIEQGVGVEADDTYIYNARTGIMHVAAMTRCITDTRHRLDVGREVRSALCRCEVTSSVFTFAHNDRHAHATLLGNILQIIAGHHAAGVEADPLQ